MQRMVFGEYDGRRSPRAAALLAAARAGGINAEIRLRGAVRSAGQRAGVGCRRGRALSRAMNRARLV
jgi:hypothetical protein